MVYNTIRLVYIIKFSASFVRCVTVNLCWRNIVLLTHQIYLHAWRWL